MHDAGGELARARHRLQLPQRSSMRWVSLLVAARSSSCPLAQPAHRHLVGVSAPVGGRRAALAAATARAPTASASAESAAAWPSRTVCHSRASSSRSGAGAASLKHAGRRCAGGSGTYVRTRSSRAFAGERRRRPRPAASSRRPPRAGRWTTGATCGREKTTAPSPSSTSTSLASPCASAIRGRLVPASRPRASTGSSAGRAASTRRSAARWATRARSRRCERTPCASARTSKSATTASASTAPEPQRAPARLSHRRAPGTRRASAVAHEHDDDAREAQERAERQRVAHVASAQRDRQQAHHGSRRSRRAAP